VARDAGVERRAMSRVSPTEALLYQYKIRARSRGHFSRYNCIDIHTAEFPHIDYASSICMYDAADAPGIDHHE
jgi:hypothetical protein